MGIFDSLQNLISGVTNSVQGSAGDLLGGITDNPVLQDVQDQVTNVTDTATDGVTSATEQGQAAIDDITQNIGL